MRTIGFAFIMLICTTIYAQNNCTNEDFAKKVSKNLPSGTENLISRITECNHWAGEDPYDKERAAYIIESVAKAKCDRIDKDKENLIKKNSKMKNALEKAFDAAEKWNEGSCN